MSRPGARMLLDDGLIALTVNDIDGGDIVCTVKNDGPVSNHKGVNVPDVHAFDAVYDGAG